MSLDRLFPSKFAFCPKNKETMTLLRDTVFQCIGPNNSIFVTTFFNNFYKLINDYFIRGMQKALYIFKYKAVGL